MIRQDLFKALQRRRQFAHFRQDHSAFIAGQHEMPLEIEGLLQARQGLLLLPPQPQNASQGIPRRGIVGSQFDRLAGRFLGIVGVIPLHQSERVAHVNLRPVRFQLQRILVVSDGHPELVLADGIRRLHDQFVDLAQSQLLDLGEGLFRFLTLPQGIQNDRVELPALHIIRVLGQRRLHRSPRSRQVSGLGRVNRRVVILHVGTAHGETFSKSPSLRRGLILANRTGHRIFAPMADVTRDTLVKTLEDIALLLELKGENPFKTRAYRNGAEIVQNFDGNIVARAADDDLKGIKGLGDALQQKLHELAATGKLEFYEKLRAEFPPDLFELFELQGLGPKKIKALYDQLGISSIAELKEACQGDEISKLSGFGAKTVEKILAAIASREKFADRFRLGEVAPLAETFLERLREHPEVHRCAIAGSYRRSKETVHDLDFLVATSKPAELTQFFTDFAEVESVLAHGETKASVQLADGLQCDLRAVSNDHFPFALQYFTGSKEHNVELRSLARKQGLSLNEYQFTGEGEIPEVEEEADIYRALGLAWVAPELRENRGEIEAARDKQLPDLVELDNLRGTFHNHTTASDGKNTLAEMAAAAREHGLQYLGIADHSKSSFQANGLDESRLEKQIDEITQLNEDFSDFALLSGSEVDILKDGSLDFPDELLARLDYCVASVHNSFNLPEKEMTARLIKAMENEHVTMLGHLTGRLLLRRDPYAVTIEKIIDCAAETRTVIELNCNPWRLDMDWRWWHRARDQGVLTSLNPDAHATEQLQFLSYGVRLARKGWLRREDVLNCRTLPEIRKWLALPKEKR